MDSISCTKSEPFPSLPRPASRPRASKPPRPLRPPDPPRPDESPPSPPPPPNSDSEPRLPRAASSLAFVPVDALGRDAGALYGGATPLAARGETAGARAALGRGWAGAGPGVGALGRGGGEGFGPP